MIYFQSAVVLAQACLVAATFGLLVQALMTPAPTEPGARRAALGEALLRLCVVIFIGSGVSKLLHVQLAVDEMAILRLTGFKYTAVASLEILSGLLVLVRRLRSLALPWVSAHVGGAICAHLIAGQYFAMLPSSVILSLFWLGMMLRHPQVLFSLHRPSRTARHGLVQTLVPDSGKA